MFGSTTYATGSSRSSRFLTSSANLSSASSVVTLSSEPIGTMCSTLRNLSDGGAPTRRLGESAGTSSSGKSRSSSTSSSKSRSYSASGTSGSSRTWYAYPYRFSSSRSSSARDRVLEDAKELPRGSDHRVRVLDSMDAAPADCHREHACRARGRDVEWRVADIRGIEGPRVEQLERFEHRLGMGLVAFGIVRADDDVEEVADAGTREHALDGRPAFRRDDAEPATFSLQLLEDRDDAVEARELRVLRIVVLAVCADELVHPLGIEELHLVREVRAADLREDLVVRKTPAQDSFRRVVERAENRRGGVDERAVEVEEDDREAHPSIVGNAREVQTVRRRCASRFGPRPPVEQRREFDVVDHRPDERAHHVPQERVGRDLEQQHVAVDDPARVFDGAYERFVLRLRTRERTEVVLADERGRVRLELCDVERSRVPPAPPRLERRPCPASPDAVAVAARPRREAGMKVGRRLLGRDDGDVFGKRRVQRLRRALRRWAAADVDARDISSRMDAGVGAPRDDETGGVGEGRGQRAAQRRFDGEEPGLTRPAAKPGAVVRQR